jgi:hypothetical protein
MRLRLPLVLATIAALLGAPSLASAAGGALGAASVSPTSGTVTTAFTLRVTYDGKFPALSVSVAVAGLELPMARITGTATEGTWSVSTFLPAGTWTPTFRSTAERGNTGTATGPTISVTGSILPSVTPAPTGTSGPPSRGNEIDDGPGSTQDPGSVDPGTAPTEGDPAAEPSGDAEPTATTPANPSPGTSASASAGVGTPQPGGSSESPRVPGSTGGGGGGDDDPDAAPGDTPNPDRPAAPGAMPASDRTDDDEPPVDVVEDWPLPMVLLVGLSGAAVLAVIGTALLILGRRRPAEERVPIVAPERRTDALLERRTLRRARVRLGDDPIVAAMGVDDQVEARRQRRRATQATSGPGERPTRPPR